MKKRRNGARAEDETPSRNDGVFVEETTGFVGDSAAVCKKGDDGSEIENPVPPAWMTPGLIERTHAVWSKRYGRSLERWEVLEILRNVRWFGELMRRIQKEGVTT